MTRRAVPAGCPWAWGFVSATLALAALGHPARAAERPSEPSGWLRQISTDLAAREYRFAPDGGERVAAPNRAQGLCVAATPDRVELTARCAAGERSPIALRLVGWGRADAPEAVARGHLPRLDGARISIERGPLVEWLFNDARGVEHGLTIASATAGDGPLVLEFAVDGALVGAAGDDGRALMFLDPAARPLVRYAGLAASDASGRALHARMFPVPGGFRIEVDDAGASYPVTIDPLATSAAWQAESNQALARFGLSVATAGDVDGDGFSDVIVGAPFFDGDFSDEGAAFLYRGSAAGPATTPSWSARGGEGGARFGISVAGVGDLDGDGFGDVVVGADGCTGLIARSGCVHVFRGSAAGLAVAADVVLQGGQSDAAFGRSVSGAGDVDGDGFADVAVGAPLHDEPVADEGRAFLYRGSPTGVLPTPAWQAGSGQAGAELGAVAGAGDVNGDGYADLVVGAPRFSAGESEEGRAWLYLGSGGGLETSAAWALEGNLAGAQLGTAVATAGDVNGDGYAEFVVGAPRWSNPEAEEGAAFVHFGSASGPAGAWTYESNLVGARVGFTAATGGDLNGDGRADLLLGIEGFGAPEPAEGRVLAFVGSAAGLSTTPYWSREIDQAGARFATVATAGDVNGDGFSDVIVGADLFDAGESDEGAAFVYYGSGDGPAATPSWAPPPDAGWQLFGYSVAPAGDVDGDGFSDVIVGDPSFLGAGGAATGLAALYAGAPGGLAPTPTWTASGPGGSAFGIAVAGAGDVDGDGYGDVVIGASDYQADFAREGAAFVYRGGPGGLAATAAWSIEGDRANARLGAAVAGAGDVNGDGFGDVAVAAPDYTGGLLFAGRVLVFHGAAAGLGSAPAWSVDGDQEAADFGHHLAPAGDVDRDGFDDLLIGDPFYLGAFLGGKAWLFRGGPSGLATSPGWAMEGEDAGDGFGRSVGSADVDGDGFTDLLVGASGSNAAFRDAGRVYLFPASAAGPANAPAWTFDGSNALAKLGWSIAAAGDVNGDGFGDVVVGAPDGTKTRAYEGRAYLFLGGGSGLASLPAWDVASGVARSDLGLSVASAGDVDGDGFSDLLIGDPDAGEIGAAFLFPGGGERGTTRAIRQRRTDGTPMALHDLTLTDRAFDALLFGRTPAGRGGVRLEVEAKPLGVPFDGTGLLVGPMTSTGDPGPGGSAAGLALRVSGLPLATPFIWRARLVSQDPLFPRSRWSSIQGNGPREADFVTWCGAAASWYLDADGDGFGDPVAPRLSDCAQPAGYVANGLDCNDADPSCFALPAEVGALTVERIGATVRISWSSQDATAGAGTAYDLVAGDLAALRASSGFGAAACRADAVPDSPFDDPSPLPAAGAGEYLLGRAQNSCAAGTYGAASIVPDPRDALDSGGPCP